MSADARLSQEVLIGLGVALAAHVALTGAIVWYARQADDGLAPANRINVSFASEVSLTSTAPDPSDDPGAAFAPEIAEMPEAGAVESAEATRTPPPPRQARATQTRPATRATPTPTPTPTATQRATGSRIGEDFLRGASDGDGARGSAAAEFGPRQQAALEQAIVRQLKPHWNPPPGADAKLLVSTIYWELNRDGSLRGRPIAVGQVGTNSANQAQARVHADNAIRAVQRAAPFNLPERYYREWHEIEWEFGFEL